jgi:hypothetical protein
MLSFLCIPGRRCRGTWREFRGDGGGIRVGWAMKKFSDVVREILSINQLNPEKMLSDSREIAANMVEELLGDPNYAKREEATTYIALALMSENIGKILAKLEGDS